MHVLLALVFTNYCIFTETVVLVVVLVAMGGSSCASIPLGRLGGIVQAVGGLGEFISSVRSQLGRSGEFATQHGFDYGNVYNSLLQYKVMHTFIAKENHRLLQAQHEETLALRDTINHSQFTQTVTTGVLLAIVAVLGLCSLITNLVSTCGRSQYRAIPRTRNHNHYDAA